MWSSSRSPRRRGRFAAHGAALLVAVLAGAALLVWPEPLDLSGGAAQPLARAAAITCRVTSGTTLRCLRVTSGLTRPVYRLLQRMRHVAPGTNVGWFAETDTAPGAQQKQIPLPWPTAVACSDRRDAKLLRCVAVDGAGTPAPAGDIALYVEQP